MSSSQSYQTTSSSESEISPLLPTSPAPATNNNGNFYFLENRRESFKSSISRTPAGEEREVMEKLPYGTTEDEFASRPIMGGGVNSASTTKNSERGIFSKIFRQQQRAFHPSPTNMTIGSLMKKRQAAIKIEPKVFFANERTFLAWLHSSVLLAGASVAIVSMSKDNFLSQLYGIILMPLAITFMVYSMHQYGRRAQMIRRRAPGPYEDIIGPAVLAVAVMFSIVAQFSIKLYQILNYE